MKVYEKHVARFIQLFHRPIKDFWEPLVGFDIVKFDREVVKPQGNDTTLEVLQRQYGEEAVVMITELVHYSRGVK